MTAHEQPSPLLLKLAELENNQNALAHTISWVTKEMDEGIQRWTLITFPFSICLFRTLRLSARRGHTLPKPVDNDHWTLIISRQALLTDTYLSSF